MKTVKITKTNKHMNAHQFTPEEDRFIMDNLHKMSKHAMAKALGVSTGYVIDTRVKYLFPNPKDRRRRHEGMPYRLFSSYEAAKKFSLEQFDETVIIRSKIHGSYVPYQYEVRFNNHPDFDGERYETGSFRSDEILYHTKEGIQYESKTAMP